MDYSKYEIIYVHGFNSHGSTGRNLESLLAKELGCKVHHPSIPQNADEAMTFLKEYLNEHKAIKLLIGSSLGGFLSLQMNGVHKIVINPCMIPSVELPKIDGPAEISNSYSKYEKLWDQEADEKERKVTYGMFSTDDELIHFKPLFTRVYGSEHVYSIERGKHKISPEETERDLLPLIKKVLKEME